MTGIRSKQRVATQERILTTARNLFLLSSFENVGVRDIAAEAGVATGTVIAAFGSKGDLLNAIIVQDLQKQLPLIRAAGMLYESTFDRLIASGISSLVYHADQIASVRASIAGAWTHSEEAENRVRSAVKPILAYIVSELQRGLSRGEVRVETNLKLAAQMIFDTVTSSYRIPIYGQCGIEDLKSVVEARLGLVLRAICLPDKLPDCQASQNNSSVAA